MTLQIILCSVYCDETEKSMTNIFVGELQLQKNRAGIRSPHVLMR
jgi:hypothetical protein